MKSIRKWDKNLKELEVLISEIEADNLVLNELIYTRLISALEILLIENLKDIFIRKPSMFKKMNKRIEFHYGEVLSYTEISQIFSKIMYQETRQLSNSGFTDILKYYRKIGIELTSCGPGKKKMIQYHEIRHLIVHRLGEVDDLYKKNYNYHDNKIQLSNSFLIQAKEDFKGFVIDLTKAVFDEIQAKDKRPKIKRNRTVILNFWFDSISNYEVIHSRNFAIRDSKRMVFLEDIIISKVLTEGKMRLIIKAKNTIINSYLEELIICKNSNPNFDFQVVRKFRESKGSMNIDPDTFQNISDYVEGKFIDKSIRNEIVEKFEISRTQMRYAVNKIIKKRENNE